MIFSWDVEKAGSYYVEVTNYVGETGSYTLTITLSDGTQDDNSA